MTASSFTSVMDFADTFAAQAATATSSPCEVSHSFCRDEPSHQPRSSSLRTETLEADRQDYSAADQDRVSAEAVLEGRQQNCQSLCPDGTTLELGMLPSQNLNGPARGDTLRVGSQAYDANDQEVRLRSVATAVRFYERLGYERVEETSNEDREAPACSDPEGCQADGVAEDSEESPCVPMVKRCARLSPRTTAAMLPMPSPKANATASRAGGKAVLHEFAVKEEISCVPEVRGAVLHELATKEEISCTPEVPGAVLHELAVKEESSCTPEVPDSADTEEADGEVSMKTEKVDGEASMELDSSETPTPAKAEDAADGDLVMKVDDDGVNFLAPIVEPVSQIAAATLVEDMSIALDTFAPSNFKRAAMPTQFDTGQSASSECSGAPVSSTLLEENSFIQSLERSLCIGAANGVSQIDAVQPDTGRFPSMESSGAPVAATLLEDNSMIQSLEQSVCTRAVTGVAQAETTQLILQSDTGRCSAMERCAAPVAATLLEDNSVIQSLERSLCSESARGRVPADAAQSETEEPVVAKRPAAVDEEHGAEGAEEDEAPDSVIEQPAAAHEEEEEEEEVEEAEEEEEDEQSLAVAKNSAVAEEEAVEEEEEAEEPPAVAKEPAAPAEEDAGDDEEEDEDLEEREDSISPGVASSTRHAEADVLEDSRRDASSSEGQSQLRLRYPRASASTAGPAEVPQRPSLPVPAPAQVLRFEQQDTLHYDGDAEALAQWNILPVSEVVGAKRKAEMADAQGSPCTASETSSAVDSLPPGPRRRFRLSGKQPAVGAQNTVSSGRSSASQQPAIGAQGTVSSGRSSASQLPAVGAHSTVSSGRSSASQGSGAHSANESVELDIMESPRAKARPKAFGRSQTSVLRESLGHDLAPPEQGTQVLVHGDGWGGGRGEYAATVTEADSLTFTVIYQNGPRAWEETHVLRSFCTSEETQREITREAKRRRAGRSAVAS